MAQNLTVARYTNGQEIAKTQQPLGGGLLREIVTVTGASSAAADTSNAYTPEAAGYGFAPIGIIGGNFKYSISGRTITLTDVNGIGTGAVMAEIVLAPTGS